MGKEVLDSLQETLPLEGHTDMCWDLKFTPDGGSVVTASEDGTFGAWNVRTGHLKHMLVTESPSLCCDVSSDGSFVAVGTKTGDVRISRLREGKQVAVLQGHNGPVTGCCFYGSGMSRDFVGREPSKSLWLCSWGADQTTRLWDLGVEGAKLKFIFWGHTGPVVMCKFSHVGNMILSVSMDTVARLWNTDTGKIRHILRGHTDSILCCDFHPSPVCEFVATGSADKTLRIWRTATGDLVNVLPGHQDSVVCCEYSQDGTILVSGSSDHTVLVWDPQTGQIMRSLQSHKSPILAAVLSPDMTRVLSTASDNDVILWDVQSGQRLDVAPVPSPAWCARFSPTGELVITGCQDGSLHMFGRKDNNIELTLKGHSGPVLCCCAHGSNILSGSVDGTLKLWSAVTGREKRTLKGHNDKWINCCDISPDGSRCVSADSSGQMLVWNLDAGRIMRKMLVRLTKVDADSNRKESRPRRSVSPRGSRWKRMGVESDEGTTSDLEGVADYCGFLSVNFTPDGNKVMTLTDDRCVRIWDIANGEPTFILDGYGGSFRKNRSPLANDGAHTGPVWSCAMSPCGRYIASASFDGLVKLWTVGGELVRTLEGHTNAVNCCRFSPDGYFLASASKDQTVKIWDLQQGSLRCTLSEHNSAVLNCSYAPSGTTLVAATAEGVLKHWDLSSVRIIDEFVGHTGAVFSCDFAVGEKAVVSSGYDGTVKVWKCRKANMPGDPPLISSPLNQRLREGTPASTNGGSTVMSLSPSPRRSPRSRMNGSTSPPRSRSASLRREQSPSRAETSRVDSARMTKSPQPIQLSVSNFFAKTSPPKVPVVAKSAYRGSYLRKSPTRGSAAMESGSQATLNGGDAQAISEALEGLSNALPSASVSFSSGGMESVPAMTSELFLRDCKTALEVDCKQYRLFDSTAYIQHGHTLCDYRVLHPHQTMGNQPVSCRRHMNGTPKEGRTFVAQPADLPKDSSIRLLLSVTLDDRDHTDPRKWQTIKVDETQSEEDGGNIIRRIQKHPNILKEARRFLDVAPSTLDLLPDSQKKPENGVEKKAHNMCSAIFVVTPYFECTLEEKLNQRERQGRLKPSEVMVVALQLCEAVNHLHSNLIAHRDIRPGTILVDDRDATVLSGMWLAMDWGTNPEASANPFVCEYASKDFVRAGDVLYSAPEILNARVGSTLDYSKADAFSVGCVIYDLCGAWWDKAEGRSGRGQTGVEWMKKGWRPKLVEPFPIALDKIARWMTCEDPEGRLDCQKAAALLQTLLWGPSLQESNTIVKANQWLMQEQLRRVPERLVQLAMSRTSGTPAGRRGEMEEHLHTKFLLECSPERLVADMEELFVYESRP